MFSFLRCLFQQASKGEDDQPMSASSSDPLVMIYVHHYFLDCLTPSEDPSIVFFGFFLFNFLSSLYSHYLMLIAYFVINGSLDPHVSHLQMHVLSRLYLR